MKLEVLNIDDDRVITMLQNKMIIDSSFHASPTIFQDANKALEYMLEHNNEEITYFILLDINMPLMDGWAFLDAINRSSLRSNIFIAMLTSSVNEADKKKAFEYTQVVAYIEKPLNAKKLMDLKNTACIVKFFIPETG